MVWSLDDLGTFLDYSSRHRMAPLSEIAAGTGLGARKTLTTALCRGPLIER
jgi:hypothetical protein